MVGYLCNLILWVEVYFSVENSDDEFRVCRRLNFNREMFSFAYIYIYVWKLNQTVLELDFRAVKFLFFPRRYLNSHHWYTAAPFACPYVQRLRPLDHIHSLRKGASIVAVSRKANLKIDKRHVYKRV